MFLGFVMCIVAAFISNVVFLHFFKGQMLQDITR